MLASYGKPRPGIDHYGPAPAIRPSNALIRGCARRRGSEVRSWEINWLGCAIAVQNALRTSKRPGSPLLGEHWTASYSEILPSSLIRSALTALLNPDLSGRMPSKSLR